MTTNLFTSSVTDKKVAWSTQETFSQTNFLQFWEVDTFLHSRPLCVTSQVFTLQKIPCVALGEGARRCMHDATRWSVFSYWCKAALHRVYKEVGSLTLANVWSKCSSYLCSHMHICQVIVKGSGLQFLGKKKGLSQNQISYQFQIVEARK